MREQIFRLSNKHFGFFCEVVAKRIFDLEWSESNEYDLIDKGHKYEVKGSRVVEKYSTRITEANIRQVLAFQKRPLPRGTTRKFDCNIQQIKPRLFDALIYALFYEDCMVWYVAPSEDIKTFKNYSAKQHRGNVGEGQFHITTNNVDTHKPYLTRVLTYDELYDIIYI